MAEATAKLRVLLIQFWVHDLGPIRTALQQVGLSVAIRRVDIEPALHAALTSGHHDLVIYDPATPSISRAVAEECMRTVRPQLELLVADDLATLGERALTVLRTRAS